LLGNGATSQASAGSVNTNLSRYFDANLRDPKLTPSAVAEAAGVSLRTPKLRPSTSTVAPPGAPNRRPRAVPRVLNTDLSDRG
jgi:hypothetical protein